MFECLGWLYGLNGDDIQLFEHLAANGKKFGIPIEKGYERLLDCKWIKVVNETTTHDPIYSCCKFEDIVYQFEIDLDRMVKGHARSVENLKVMLGMME